MNDETATKKVEPAVSRNHAVNDIGLKNKMMNNLTSEAKPSESSVEVIEEIEENTEVSNKHLEQIAKNIAALLMAMTASQPQSGTIPGGDTSVNMKQPTPANYYSWSIPFSMNPNAGGNSANPAF
jgi:hypothetical protein